ncbi:PD-(D/E)XK nuclease family protein [Halochromatium roseum]|uniref:PD-(D/E)XK nuclease family protein n=1 Tax=Halochromatium roseum TaxID=391920 RepID=UPI0019120952|nr:DUF3782 domain-containing protein [Halochromatium roseum]MBK5940867.1 hypothetical protein [Halochromatium roseum]
MSTLESIKETVKRELPAWLESDPAFRQAILDLTASLYSRRDETNDWFHQTLDEMRRERERQDARWRKNDERLERERQESERKWEEQNRKWEANQVALKALQEEQKCKWDEQNYKWEANQVALKALQDEQNRKWDEQNRKWDSNQAELKSLHEEILALGKRIDRSIGALGARWGLRSEKAFRDALAGILEKTFGVEVLNVCEYDDEGAVFGRPDQIELDVLIKNGLLILCELKSSIDKAGMYIFERKARFYERRHDRQADRLIVISPMIDSRAQDVARRLGIETYGEPEEVSN